MNILEHIPYDNRLTRFFPRECCGGNGSAKYEFATINGQSIISGGNIEITNEFDKNINDLANYYNITQTDYLINENTEYYHIDNICCGIVEEINPVSLQFDGHNLDLFTRIDASDADLAKMTNNPDKYRMVLLTWHKRRSLSPVSLSNSHGEWHVPMFNPNWNKNTGEQLHPAENKYSFNDTWWAIKPNQIGGVETSPRYVKWFNDKHFEDVLSYQLQIEINFDNLNEIDESRAMRSMMMTQMDSGNINTIIEAVEESRKKQYLIYKREMERHVYFKNCQTTNQPKRFGVALFKYDVATDRWNMISNIASLRFVIQREYLAPYLRKEGQKYLPFKMSVKFDN